jgi:hypothetical protein
MMPEKNKALREAAIAAVFVFLSPFRLILAVLFWDSILDLPFMGRKPRA